MHGFRLRGDILSPLLPKMYGPTSKTGHSRVQGPSTPRVVAVAIAHNHKGAGFDVPVHYGVARIVLDGLARDDAPFPNRAPPLDLDCCLAIRKAAHQLRSGRSDGAYC